MGDPPGVDEPITHRATTGGPSGRSAHVSAALSSNGCASDGEKPLLRTARSVHCGRRSLAAETQKREEHGQTPEDESMKRILMTLSFL
ncbi:MAG: hypothetical protein K8H88_21370, partial [Sandaracinaceae bacterium]|nr:hypothetical protein [Sandaracinaceae bacterium]